MRKTANLTNPARFLRKAATLMTLFGMGLILGNCSRAQLTHGCKESNTIMLPQHMLDYFYFKTGSWWVYVQEGGDGSKRDSVWVDSDNLSFENPEKAKKDCGCAKGWCEQTAIVRLRNHESDSLKRQYFVEYRMATNGLTDVDQRNFQSHELGQSLFGGSIGPFVLYRNNHYESSNDRKDEINTIEQVVLNRNEYYKVFHTRITDGSIDYYLETFHVAKVGLIKFTKGDGTKWILVSQNIVL